MGILRNIGVAAATILASLASANGAMAQEEYERSFTTMRTYPERPLYPPGYEWQNPNEIPGNLTVIPMSLIEANLPMTSSGGTVEEPLPEIVMNKFLEELDYWRANPGRCARSPWSNAHSGADCEVPTLTVLEAITYEERNAVLIGEIEHITPSWSVGQKRVISMVYVRVIEALEDSTGTVNPGSLVVYQQPWGSFEVGDVSLCTYPPPGYLATQTHKIGDQVLLAGRHDLMNEGNIILHSGLPFHLSDGEVLPLAPSLGNCFLPETASLEAIRQTLEMDQ